MTRDEARVAILTALDAAGFKYTFHHVSFIRVQIPGAARTPVTIEVVWKGLSLRQRARGAKDGPAIDVHGAGTFKATSYGVAHAGWTSRVIERIKLVGGT